MARFRLTVQTRAAPSVRGAAYVPRPRPASSGRRRRWTLLAPTRSSLVGRFFVLLAGLLVVVGAWNYLQQVPNVAPATTLPARFTIPGSAPNLPWPGLGSGAIGVTDLGVIASSGAAGPAPTASIAKVMTALVVLADKPLAAGQIGPTLVMTAEDVASYQSDAAQQQSVVPVAAGEGLTELEALEALLIPSGNNIAETLARWDAGSIAAFVARMNQRATTLGLTHTVFADPSGVSTQTVSTPGDLVLMGMAAMQQDVLAQIVSQPQTTLPVAGTVYNVNAALGQHGIVGIKTGSGLDFGANFLFAARATIGGRQLTLFGCVMGQPTLDAAFAAAKDLVAAMTSSLSVDQVVTSGDIVGGYDTPWGEHADLVATAGVTLVEWPGMVRRQQLVAPALAIAATVPNGSPAGRLHVELGGQQYDVPLVTSGSLDPPGLPWRLFRVNLQ